MNFGKNKRKMAFLGLIIASVTTVFHVRASPSADSKQNCKEYPPSRHKGNKSQGAVIDLTITNITDTELERGNLYVCGVIARLTELLKPAFLADARK